MGFKHDYDKALYRYTQIIAKLYNGAKLSNTELAKEFNVSTKTIQRDFSKLVNLFPIYQENRLWQLDKEYELKENINIKDEITLKILFELSKSFDESFSKRATNLLNRIDENINSPIYTKIELENISNKLDTITQIESAIKSKNKILFSYLKDDEYYEHQVEPYKIVNFEGFWYLIARKNKSLRRYYLQHIFDMEILDETFRKSKKLESSISNAINIWFDENESFEVELLIDSSIVKYIQRKPISKTQRLKEYKQISGDMIITLDISNEREIIPIVKYWLPNIKVLKPIWIQEMIEDEVRKFLK
jgi:predicted DNA-binding transcriptional regulator YafY